MTDMPHILIPVMYAAGTAILIWWQWRRFRAECAERHMTYRITEIWAGIVGLMPSIAFFADSIQGDRFPVFIPICMAISQIGGIVVLKILHEREPEAHNPTATVLLGGVFGMFLFIAAPFALILMGVIFGLAIIFFPLWVLSRPAARGSGGE